MSGGDVQLLKPTEVFAIVGPEGFVRAVQFDKTQAWSQFFSYASGGLSGARYALPLEEAIRAYEAIGYRCVECVLAKKPESTKADPNCPHCHGKGLVRVPSGRRGLCPVCLPHPDPEIAAEARDAFLKL
jgi:DNA-directed RNA polymerase subunit RPC12/RpoP